MADKCIFLDRDNTIIHDPGYLRDPAAVRLLEGAGDALNRLAKAGYKLVVVTNQSGIARGLLTDDVLAEVHRELQRQLGLCGARLDAIYYCPYHPEGTVEGLNVDSPDRKPSPGMLLKAADEWNLDLEHSWMVGDSGRDVEAGRRAGCRTILLASPARGGAQMRAAVPRAEEASADFIARDLSEAADIILRHERD